jgi:hypothetical protein
MVSLLAIGPKVPGFKSGRGDGFSKDDRNPQRSFGRKVKPEVTCKILRHVKVTWKV